MTQNIWGPVINEIWDKYDDNKPLKPKHAKNTSNLPYLVWQEGATLPSKLKAVVEWQL